MTGKKVVSPAKAIGPALLLQADISGYRLSPA